MKFPNYRDFKNYIWYNYQPFPEELTPPEAGFQLSTHWAKRNAPRFFRALKMIDSLMDSNFSVLDVGAYPGSFSKLIKASFGEGVTTVYACGMMPDESFEKRLSGKGIIFLECNLDPDIKTPFTVPVELPLESNSVDCITLMEVVEHLYSLKTSILECYRVLKPNGICYLTTNNISDRAGLLRILCKNSTNLDEDLEETSIWSDHENIWRGHVRFFSLNQLCEVGRKAGFSIEQTGYFQNYEDPDVFIWNKEDLTWVKTVRQWLRGNGQRPPIQLKNQIKSMLHLGVRSLSPSYNSHIELVYRKPYQ